MGAGLGIRVAFSLLSLEMHRYIWSLYEIFRFPHYVNLYCLFCICIYKCMYFSVQLFTFVLASRDMNILTLNCFIIMTIIIMIILLYLLNSSFVFIGFNCKHILIGNIYFYLHHLIMINFSRVVLYSVNIPYQNLGR